MDINAISYLILLGEYKAWSVHYHWWRSRYSDQAPSKSVTMAMVTLKCEWDECSWVSVEAKIDICLRHIEIHLRANHPPDQIRKSTALHGDEVFVQPMECFFDGDRHHGRTNPKTGVGTVKEEFSQANEGVMAETIVVEEDQPYHHKDVSSMNNEEVMMTNQQAKAVFKNWR